MPAISVIIPVLNESGLDRLLDHLCRSASGVPIQLILVDGAPDGGSCRFVSNPDVIKVIAPPGRASQMNAGARLATAQTLLFLHADSFPPDGWAQAVIDASNSGYDAGAFELAIDDTSRIFRLIESAVSLRCRLTRVPYGDQGIFVSRQLFRKIGGYNEIPFLEDVALMRRLKKLGEKIVVIDKPVLTSARRWKSEGVIRCSLRNRLVMALYLLGVSPVALKRFY